VRGDGVGRWGRWLGWWMICWGGAIGFWGCGRAPIPSDVLVIAQTAEPRSLDPHATTALNDFQIAANLYEGLVRFRPGSLEIGPGLAEAWEVSEDGLRYAFVLRRGVRFHDGTPFDAEAVRFNLERMLDPAHPAAETGPFPLAFFFAAIERIETPEPHLVVLHLREPFAPLLSNLASPTGYMVSPRAVMEGGGGEDVGAEGRDRRLVGFGRHPVGTGPYRFADWKAGQWVRLERFDDYAGEAARTPTLIFRPITDENARLTELLAGGVDVVTEVSADLVAFFRGEPGYRVVEEEGPHLWFLILNTRYGPFADERMRLAVQLAIDREALVQDLLQGTATLAVSAIPRAFRWATDPELQPHPHDPERARALIGEAGHAGARLRMVVPESGAGMLAPRAMAAAIQADLREVGLELRIETYEWNTYLDRVNAGLGEEVDMAQMAWMVNDPDTLPFLALRRAAWPEFGGFNSGYYANDAMEALLGQARRATDAEVRAGYYRQVEALAWREVPWIFVASWRQNAVTGAEVEGLRLEPSFLLELRGVWKGGGAG